MGVGARAGAPVVPVALVSCGTVAPVAVERNLLLSEERSRRLLLEGELFVLRLEEGRFPPKCFRPDGGIYSITFVSSSGSGMAHCS